MSRSLKTIFYTALSLVTCGALAAGSVSAANKTLTIKGSNADTGDTIQIPDTAEVSVQVADEGITITMPNLDLRLRCLGDVTADGYCYVAAGGAGGGGSDNPDDLDFDRVPDVWDQCPNTPAGAPYTDKRGCADMDGDGYFTDQDDCPTQGGAVGTDGCPTDSTVNYTITASAGTGGSISPSGAVSIASGSTRSFTVAAQNGYSVQSVSGSCGGNLAGNVYTTNPVTQNCTVTATFATQVVGTGYCQGAPAGYADKLSCSSSVSLDPFPAKTSNYPGLGIPSGKVLSLPFTSGSDASTEGMVKLNSLQYAPAGYTFKAWFSTVPAGETYQNGYFCKYTGSRAFKQMIWSQTAGGIGCPLATDQTFHFNLAVICNGTLPSECTQGTLWDDDYYLELTNQDR